MSWRKQLAELKHRHCDVSPPTGRKDHSWSRYHAWPPGSVRLGYHTGPVAFEVRNSHSSRFHDVMRRHDSRKDAVKLQIATAAQPSAQKKTTKAPTNQQQQQQQNEVLDVFSDFYNPAVPAEARFEAYLQHLRGEHRDQQVLCDESQSDGAESRRSVRQRILPRINTNEWNMAVLEKNMSVTRLPGPNKGNVTNRF